MNQFAVANELFYYYSRNIMILSYLGFNQKAYYYILLLIKASCWWKCLEVMVKGVIRSSICFCFAVINKKKGDKSLTNSLAICLLVSKAFYSVLNIKKKKKEVTLYLIWTAQ